MLSFIITVFCNFLDCSEIDMYELSLKSILELHVPDVFSLHFPLFWFGTDFSCNLKWTILVVLNFTWKVINFTCLLRYISVFLPNEEQGKKWLYIQWVLLLWLSEKHAQYGQHARMCIYELTKLRLPMYSIQQFSLRVSEFVMNSFLNLSFFLYTGGALFSI